MSQVVLFLDIETTGLDPEKNDIVSVGAVPVVDGELIEPFFHEYVRNEIYPVSAEVMKNRPMTEQIRISVIKGDPEFAVLERLRAFVNNLRGGNRTIIVGGKNVSKFDLPFLEFYGLDAGRWFHHRRIDVGNLFLQPSDPVPPGLAETAARAGVPFDEAGQHNALNDAYACALIYQKWYHNYGR